MLIIYTYSAHKRPLIDITFKLITLKTMIFLFYFEQHKAIWTEAILATIFFSAKLKFYDDEIEFWIYFRHVNFANLTSTKQALYVILWLKHQIEELLQTIFHIYV